jgi:hypothetical protein
LPPALRGCDDELEDHQEAVIVDSDPLSRPAFRCGKAQQII